MSEIQLTREQLNRLKRFHGQKSPTPYNPTPDVDYLKSLGLLEFSNKGTRTSTGGIVVEAYVRISPEGENYLEWYRQEQSKKRLIFLRGCIAGIITGVIATLIGAWIARACF